MHNILSSLLINNVLGLCAQQGVQGGVRQPSGVGDPFTPAHNHSHRLLCQTGNSETNGEFLIWALQIHAPALEGTPEQSYEHRLFASCWGSTRRCRRQHFCGLLLLREVRGQSVNTLK